MHKRMHLQPKTLSDRVSNLHIVLALCAKMQLPVRCTPPPPPSPITSYFRSTPPPPTLSFCQVFGAPEQLAAPRPQ